MQGKPLLTEGQVEALRSGGHSFGWRTPQQLDDREGGERGTPGGPRVHHPLPW